MGIDMNIDQPGLVTRAILAISYGLSSTLSTTTSTSKCIGYQALYGITDGGTTTAPYLAIHNLVAPESISLAKAIIVFW